MLRSFSVPLVVALVVSGCPYGDGAPCEVNRDCASGRCCGATSRIRGVCRPMTEPCAIAFDAGSEDAPAQDTGASDAPGGTDAGADVPAPIDAPPDVPMDAPLDAPADARTIDAPPSTDAPEPDVLFDA